MALEEDIDFGEISEALNDKADRDFNNLEDGAFVPYHIEQMEEEVENRIAGDNALQEQIDAIVSKQELADIVGTYADLQAYDKSKLQNNAIIEVLQDETHDNAVSYYKFNSSSQSFSYIGSTAATYTKQESDSKYVKLTGAETIEGTKTFNTTPIVGTATSGDNSTKAASTAFVQTAISTAGNNYVHLTGNEIINGTKTFNNTIYKTSTIDHTSTSGEIEVNSLGVYDNQNRGISGYNTTRSTTTNTNRQRICNFNVGSTGYWYDLRTNLRDDGHGFVSTAKGSNVIDDSTTYVTNSTGSAIIPTMGWVNNPETSTNVVHRSGNETISGEKKFTSTPQTKLTTNDESAQYNDGYKIVDTSLDITTNPSYNKTYYWAVKDSSNRYLGWVGSTYYTTGQSTTTLSARTRNTDNTDYVSASINVSVKRDGTQSTFAPTPTEDTTTSTQIDTVGARNTKLASYALDSNVVHRSGDESISGTKTFNDNIITLGYIKGTTETGSAITNHAIALGHNNVNHMDFFEYGGVFNFYKSRSGTNTLLLKLNDTTTSVIAPTEDTTTSTQIDTVGARNTKLQSYALDNNVVHKTGSEEITGTKTFSADQKYACSDTNADLTQQSTSNEYWWGIRYVDKNNVQGGLYQYKRTTNGTAECNIQARALSTNPWSKIAIYQNADGTDYATGPTPTEDTINSIQLDTVGARNTKLQGYQTTITGAASTITSNDLTTSKALISNASGKVAVSDTTDTELGYVHGVTSAIQTQLDNKQGTISDLETIRTGAGKGATALQSSDIIDNTESTATNKVLSANQGKVLQEQINDLKAVGRFLSIWNCTTGKPTTDPETLPYPYHTGDYYLVGIVNSSGTNYKPNGSSYTGAASTTVETETVKVADMYYYDGSVWQLSQNSQRTVSFADIAGQPSDNTNLASALNDKLTKNTAITAATKCKITYDTNGLVTAGADLQASDIPNITLSKISDVTATASELNILDGITASTAELNILDGVTASTAEINILDGVTASTAELNYVDGVTSNIQTQLNSKPADTDVVHKTDNEIISGVKTFNSPIKGRIDGGLVYYKCHNSGVSQKYYKIGDGIIIGSNNTQQVQFILHDGATGIAKTGFGFGEICLRVDSTAGNLSSNSKIYFNPNVPEFIKNNLDNIRVYYLNQQGEQQNQVKVELWLYVEDNWDGRSFAVVDRISSGNIPGDCWTFYDGIVADTWPTNMTGYKNAEILQGYAKTPTEDTTTSTQIDTVGARNTKLSSYQPTLVSGTNIKTVNGNSLLGSGNITIDSLPSQSGQSGKYLTTNGTSASWATITIPQYTSGTGISINGTVINHSNSITAGTAGTSSSTSGSSLAVPYITYDAQGHITASGTHVHTVTGFLTSNDIDQTYSGTSTNAQSGVAVKSAIDAAISSVYKPAGSTTFANKPSLSSSIEGYVYNVSDAFTTTNDFVEGSGKSYPAGTNIVCINTTTSGTTYKWDVLAGFIDLSGYQATITGAATTITSSNLTKNRAVISNGSGKVAVSSVTDTELGYLSGVTSSIQTQLNNKQTSGNYVTSDIGVTHTASTAVGSSKKPIYIASDGKATAISYTIEKSVPSNAVFTDTTYSDMVGADGTNAGSSGLVPAPAATSNAKFLRGDGTWQTPTNTKNTAGSTNTSSKIFLIGATSQAANPQTYSHDTAFVDANGRLNSAAPDNNANDTTVATTNWVNNAITAKSLPGQTGNSGKFLQTDGTNASWQNVSSLPLLYRLYSETILNDANYLRSNNNWCSSSVYPDAYNHLLSDFNGTVTNKTYKTYKQSNVTYYGNIADRQGMLDGFSGTTSYATFNSKNPTTSMELVIKVKSPTTLSTSDSIIDRSVEYNGIVLRFYNASSMRCYISGNGTSWSIANPYNPSVNITTSTWYWFKITWDGSTYKFYISEDGTTYIQCGTISSSVAPKMDSQSLGGSGLGNNDLGPDGIIDLNECYLNIDGSRYWTGCDYYNVNYLEAEDGHKIVTAANSSDIESIYEKEGASEWFILDTTNTRFKLPRTLGRKLIKTYKDEISWYNLYSDGWVEQGSTTMLDYNHGQRTIPLLIEMEAAHYFVSATTKGFVANGVVVPCYRNLTTTSFELYGDYTSASDTLATAWEVKGYSNAAVDQYEYYYVGGALSGAGEVDCSEILEELNYKLDADRIQFVSTLPANPVAGVYYFISEE